MKPKIAKVVVGLPLDGPFDYRIGGEFEDRIAIGVRVRVNFNRRDRLGFVVGLAERSSFKSLNPVLSILDKTPVFDASALKLAEKIHLRYGCSLGEAMEACLPPALRHYKTAVEASFPPKPGPTVSDENKKILVHDRTRHKRWAVIAGHIQKGLEEGRRAIVLVPEIVFVGQALAVLKEALPCRFAVLDKKLSPKKEQAQWEEMRSGRYDVVIGVRSAVFAPLPGLGLIVVDEEENEAYKQEQVPHYRAGDVVRMRSEIEGCRVLFSSSAPSAETWEKAGREKWERIVLPEDKDVTLQVVDMGNYRPGKTSLLSFPLQNAVQTTLEAGGKVLLFMNRRGFTTRTHCQQCGFTVKCRRCNVNLVYLYSKKMMVCRHCNVTMELPKVCPQCNGSYLRSTGVGVEKLESEVARYYPGARISRYDGGHKGFVKDADITIATQAVFHRHDPWSVALAALLNFDDQIHHYDFRSGQKVFSLLIRLRQLAQERLLVQTRMADNYCLKAVKTMDFDQFYREELRLRKELGLPPYRHLVSLGLRGKKEPVVFEQAHALSERLEEGKPKGVEISDPHPDVNPKLRDQYRYTILLKGRALKSILALIKRTLKGFKKRNIIIAVNVDP